MVPVLSNKTALIAWVPSKYSPPLNRIPFSAPRPEPTIIDVGVASPNAQGQAMTNTAIDASNACDQTPGSTMKNHAAKVTNAMTTTMGTKTLDILSAIRWIGAFDPWASSTIFTIPASAVSFPTFSATIVIVPFLFTVAPITGSSIALPTGIGSPVNIDSSIDVVPSIT